MPSFLALINLMLALLVLRVSIEFAAVAVSVSLICYVIRTVLMQAQAIHDQTVLRKRNDQLEGLAVRDPLTGIGNRRSLAQIYSCLQLSGEPRSVSLLLMDIDHFKQANDSHGHLYGDKILMALAKELEKIAAHHPGSHCARFGGDEFALLLPNISRHEGSKVANELRALFAANTSVPGRTWVTLSIGVASSQRAADMPLEVAISEADEALYRAKRHGRDRVELQAEAPSEDLGHSTPALRPRLQFQHDAN